MNAPVAERCRAWAFRTVPKADTTVGCTRLARSMASARVSLGSCARAGAAPSSEPATSSPRTPRLQMSIPIPIWPRATEAVQPLDQRGVFRLLLRSEQGGHFVANELALGFELGAHALPEGIHRRLMTVEDHLDAVTLAGGEVELLGEPLHETGPGAIVGAGVTATIGERGGRTADKGAQRERGDQQHDGGEAGAHQRPPPASRTPMISSTSGGCGLTSLWAGSDATVTPGSAAGWDSENHAPSQSSRPAATARAPPPPPPPPPPPLPRPRGAGRPRGAVSARGTPPAGSRSAARAANAPV